MNQGNPFLARPPLDADADANAALKLLTKDMTLVAAMSIVCPSNEVDELSVALLTIFEHRGQSFELLETLIKQEIEETGPWRLFYAL